MEDLEEISMATETQSQHTDLQDLQEQQPAGSASSSLDMSSKTPVQTSFSARLKALSGSRARTQPRPTNTGAGLHTSGITGAHQVRTRLEKLSNRLAARAAQIQQEKQLQRAAILDHVEALERRIADGEERRSNLERKMEGLLESLSEERRARLEMQSSFQEQLTNLVHRIGVVRQEMEASASETQASFSSQLQAIVEDAASSVNATKDLSSSISENAERLTKVEESIPMAVAQAKEALRLVDIQKRVKEETSSTLISLVDKSLSDLRNKLSAEVATRERNESAVLSILEGMSGVDE